MAVRSGGKIKLYEEYNVNVYSNASVATAPTTSAKRGRPRKQTPEKVRLPRRTKRKAKVNASS